MMKSKKIRSLARKNTSRRNFLRIERLEDRMVLTGAAPIAVNDTYQLLPDQTLDISAPGILANDTDAEGDSLTAALFSGPAHGTLTLDPAGSFEYIPEAGFAGIDSFMYASHDGTGHSQLAAVTLRVGNTAPVAQNDSYTLNEDETLTIPASGLLGNDSDPDGDPLTAALVSGPLHGSLSLNSDGSFSYTPEANFHGLDGFSYMVQDASAQSSVATVTLEVVSVNDGPAAVNDEYTTDEDTALSVNTADGLLGNDTDADGDTLTASLVSGPSHGTLTLNADGSFDYTPEANFSGVDGFSYLVNDGTTNSDVASVTLNVTGINDGPTAVNDEYTTNEDTALTMDVAGGLLVNDTDPDSASLTAALVGGPMHGAVTLNPDGSFTYTPSADFNGVDGFSYVVSDGTLESDVATVTINVTSVPDAPAAAADAFATDEDTPLVVDAAGVLANDTDADGDSLTAALVSGPAHGTLTLNSDGSLNYTPEANFTGEDSFVYSASDSSLTSEATVTITVNPLNDAPSAAADEYSTDEDTALHVDASGVLSNDSDPDGDSLTATLVSGPANGTLTLNADGSFDYAPGSNFNGDDSFVYTAGDSISASAETTVTIHVAPVNDSPAAAADAFSTEEDTPLTISAPGVLANDSDADGDALTAELVSGPSHGALILNADGSMTYTPEANFNGEDSFVYKASDGSSTSEATVTITVGAANDAPSATADEYSTDEDTALHVDAPGVLANDIDSDGDSLMSTLVSGPANGTLTLDADGSFDYVPGTNFNGDDSFVYTAGDASSSSGETTVTIHVAAVNDAPVNESDSYLTDEDTPLVISAPGVLANDSDPEGDPLTAALVTGPAHGTVSLSEDGSFTYTPEANFNGSDSFTYKASDGSAESGETTVSIVVNSTPDAPITHNDAYSTGEDVPLTASVEMGVLANDFDPQDLPLTAELVTGPTNGTLSLNSDGSFSYTPSANFHGTDSFTYVANNGAEAGPEMTATITVQPLNDAPQAVNDDYTADVSGNVNATISVGVLANDTDIDADPLAATLLWGPSHGSLTMNADGSFSYTATAGYSGTDTFKYQANDGMANSNVATVTLHIGNPEVEDNTPPASADDEYSVDTGSTLTVAAAGVLTNDTDVDNDVLSAILVGGPSHGTVTLNVDGSFEYTPEAGFLGTDTFTYAADDGKEAGNEATVSITVNDPNENHNPDAKDDGYVANAETPLSISSAEGVLANDTDEDGDPLTAVLVAGAGHGTLTLNADGSFDYQPEIGFTGTDSFTYQAADGSGLSEVATVEIAVGSSDNHRPAAVNDRYTTTVDTPLSVPASGIMGNDSDPDGDALTAVLFSGPQNGTVVLNTDGSFVYTPASGFQGRDSFVYRTFDGEVHSALAAVTIYVNAAPASTDGGDDDGGPDIVDGGDGGGNGCLLGGALRSVMSHLELARSGIDEELLDSLAEDQSGFGNMNPWHDNGRWL